MKILKLLKAHRNTKKALKKASGFSGPVVLAWNHIGDICLALSMLPAFGGGPVLVVGSKKHTRLFESYQGAGRSFLLLDDIVIEGMLSCARNDYLKRVFHKYQNVIVTDPWFYFDYALEQKRGFNILDFYRECVFHYGGPLELPTVQEPLSQQTEAAVSGKRFTILSPYAGSTDGIDPGFWKEVVAELKTESDVVICNVGPGQKPIDGTVPFAGSVFELCELAKNARAMVGLRSGAFDIVRGVKIPSFAIYNGKYMNLYSLSAWGGEEPIVEHDYGEGPTKILDSLKLFLKKIG